MIYHPISEELDLIATALHDLEDWSDYCCAHDQLMAEAMGLVEQ